ncbi:MAG: YCF48-related protein, partial [Desulfobacteraceae bacterium]
MLKLLRILIGGLAAASIALPAMTFGASVQGVLDRPALKVREPAGSVLIDVTRAEGRLVAVGERGIIVYSDDAGETWQQAQVPVSVGLTAVHFSNPQSGWAVGHGGVVVHTVDGGKTWVRQLEGVQAAQMALENAQARAERVGPEDLDAQQMVDNAKLLAKDGPDKPFLDLYFENDRVGFVVGSYGLIFKTEDGGVTWKCLMDSVENPSGLNLYAIHAAGEAMYIAGEQGLFLVS